MLAKVVKNHSWSENLYEKHDAALERKINSLWIAHFRSVCNETLITAQGNRSKMNLRKFSGF